MARGDATALPVEAYPFLWPDSELRPGALMIRRCDRHQNPEYWGGVHVPKHDLTWLMRNGYEETYAGANREGEVPVEAAS